MQFFYLLLVFSANFLAITSICQTDKYYIIRNQPSGLVLEGNGNEVTLQFFTGYETQLWKFECAGAPGIYNILNKHLIPALDIERVNDTTVVVLRKRDLNSDSQQWIANADGTLFNVNANLYIDILLEGEDTTVPKVGDSLDLVSLDSGNENQKFTLQVKL